VRAAALGCRRDRIQVANMISLRAFLIPLVVAALIVMGGCGPSGPREADMAGCAVCGGGPPISSREVADCAVERAERAAARAEE
jgi:hypothetical protein